MPRLAFSGREATSHVAVVVSFDLVGFSNFCNQPETSIVAPKLIKLVFDALNEFLSGLDPLVIKFKEWPHSLCATDSDKLVEPSFVKFTGDGALLFWVCPFGETLPQEFCDLVVQTMRAFQLKVAEQLPIAEKEWRVHALPKRLRVGISTGIVYGMREPHIFTSMNDPIDYVGYCINLAVRLQNHCPDLGFLVHGNMHPQVEGMELLRTKGTKGTQDEPVALFSEDLQAVTQSERRLKFSRLQ